MSSTYDPERVLRVECPVCGAGSGEQCKTATGNYRNKHDYHANRKGVVYPEFARSRRGFSDPTRKANKVMEALDAYLKAAWNLSEGVVTPSMAKARDELFAALKDGFTHGK